MCINKMAPKLFTLLRGECETQAAVAVSSLVGQTPDHVSFLSLLEVFFLNLNFISIFITGVFRTSGLTNALQYPPSEIFSSTWTVPTCFLPALLAQSGIWGFR